MNLTVLSLIIIITAFVFIIAFKRSRDFKDNATRNDHIVLQSKLLLRHNVRWLAITTDLCLPPVHPIAITSWFFPSFLYFSICRSETNKLALL